MPSEFNQTWRQSNFTIKAGSEYELVLDDTTPNQAYINNYGLGKIYVGINMIPNDTKYEFCIEGAGSNVIGRPTAFTRLYFYNPSLTNCSISVMSCYDNFSMNILKNVNISLSGEVADQIKYDGVIKGFDVPLPTGNNSIGKVEVSKLPVIPSGTNNIGSVNVAQLPALSEGTNNIGNVNVSQLPALPEGTNNIGSVKVSELPTNKENYHSTEFTFQSGSVTYEIDYIFNEIAYIINEGTAPLQVSFKRNDNNYGQNIILNQGQQITNIKLSGIAYKITPLGTGCKFNILLLGV
jgi:hypothetical protein